MQPSTVNSNQDELTTQISTVQHLQTKANTMTNLLSLTAKAFTITRISRRLGLSMILLCCFVPAITSAQGTDIRTLSNEHRNDSPEDKRLQRWLSLSEDYLSRKSGKRSDLDSAAWALSEAKKISNANQSSWRKVLYTEGWLAAARQDKQAAEQLYTQAFRLAEQYDDRSLKGDLSIARAQLYANTGLNYETKQQYFGQALSFYKQAGDILGQAHALKEMGNMNQLADSVDEAIRLLEQSLALYQQAGYKPLQGIYQLLCVTYRQKSNLPLAMHYGFLALKTAEAQHDKSNFLAVIYNQMAVLYSDLKNDTAALAYYYKSRAKAIAVKDTYFTQIASVNVARQLTRVNQAQQAVALLENSVKTYPPESDEMKMHTTDALLMAYLGAGNKNKAREYYSKLDYFYVDMADDDPQRAFPAKSIAHYLIANYQYKQAYPYIQTMEALNARSNNAVRAAGTELLYFQADSGTGQWQSAIRHFQRYKQLNDSLFNIDKARQFSAMELQYQTEKKDKDIQLLTQKGVVKDVQIKQGRLVRNIIAGGVIMLLLLLGLGYNRYRLKQRSNLALQKKQDELNLQYELVKKLLGEKEWLLKEIHHRVKNNLQIVISLLNSQSAYLDNVDALEAIRSSQHRMQAMSLIHQKLYQSDNLAGIDMEWYIRELISCMKEGFDTAERIRFVTDVDSLELDVAQAVPVGLILNEAINNAIKYAFPDAGQGIISVGLKNKGTGSCTLWVQDNGIGLSEDFDIDMTDSLGMSLMQGLSQQLGGTFTLNNHNGLALQIEFEISAKGAPDNLL